MPRIIEQQGRTIATETGELLAEEFQVLDVYEPTGVRAAEPWGDWLATISAGYRAEDGRPVMDRGGKIHLHDPKGQAPALRAALEATEYRSLTIAFPFDELDRFIHQAFKQYSAWGLDAVGDQYALTEIVRTIRENKVVGADRHVFAVGTDDYERVKARCRVEVAVSFALALWDGPQARVIFPDGFAPYRLRFTGRHSLYSLVGSLQQLRLLTGGRLSGVPFELAIEMRQVAGPDGVARDVAVWVPRFKPPEVLQLSSGNFRQIVGQALAQGDALRLLPTPAETIEQAEQDEPDVDLESADGPDALAPVRELDPLPATTPSAAAIQQVIDGDPPCESQYWNHIWHAVVRGTALAEADGRHAFVTQHTKGRLRSLKAFWAEARESEATAFFLATCQEVDRLRQPRVAPTSQEATSDPLAAHPSAERGSRSSPPLAAAPSGPSVEADQDPLWQRYVGLRDRGKMAKLDADMGGHFFTLTLPQPREYLELVCADLHQALERLARAAQGDAQRRQRGAPPERDARSSQRDDRPRARDPRRLSDPEQQDLPE